MNGPVVGTVMTNLGIELAFKDLGIEFHRAKVGDRNVLAMLQKNAGMIGGEASGHLICLDKTTTGDGLVSALQVLEIMSRRQKSLKELVSGMQIYPQKTVNVKVSGNFDLASHPEINEAINDAEAKLGQRGRVVLRSSGTEPLVRVMIEGEDEASVISLANSLADFVKKIADNR